MLIHKAIEFAALKHKRQLRKGTETPYIVHPMEVMQILTHNRCCEEVIVAGILHDTIEDTDTTYNELSENFGKTIADIVFNESDDKTKSWKQRKQNTIEKLKHCDRATKLVCCADKLSNLKSMLADYSKVGERLWDRFSPSKKEIMWYYSGVISSLSDLKDFNMYHDLKLVYRRLFECDGFKLDKK